MHLVFYFLSFFPERENILSLSFEVCQITPGYFSLRVFVWIDTFSPQAMTQNTTFAIYFFLCMNVNESVLHFVCFFPAHIVMYLYPCRKLMCMKSLAYEHINDRFFTSNLLICMKRAGSISHWARLNPN